MCWEIAMKEEDITDRLKTLGAAHAFREAATYL
jgi:hypothetical protein